MSTSVPAADPGALLAAAKPARPDALARFVTPARPDAAMLEQLHRGHDGFVSFGRKDDGEHWRDLFAVRADELAAMFPRVAEWLTADAYFTINATYRPGYGRSAADGRLPRACHRSTALRWLTACFVDLDTAHSPHGLTDGQAVGALIDAQDRGVVPPATIIVRSGRGLWALWILRAADGCGPVRAWPEKIDAWQRAQRRIGQLFAALAADPAARDACRVMRVPGSLNTKARRRVAYWIQTDAAGQPFRYTLPELCGALGVPVRSLYAAARAVCSEAARERGRRGSAGRWAKALRQFETLRALRGGFRRGMRARACFVLACILRRLNVAEAEIAVQVRRLAGECLDAAGRHPDPLPESEADDAAALGTSPGPGLLRNDTIADRLDVTPEEAAQLESWPAASRFSTGQTSTDEGDRLTKPERAERRRTLIADLLRAARGRVPTLAAIRLTLETAGLPATERTIARDLLALGVRNPRAWDRDGSQLPLGTVAIPGVCRSKLIGGGPVPPSRPCPDPVPAPPSLSERRGREGTRPERRAVTTGVPTDAPRVQLPVPLSGAEPVAVAQLEHEAEARERLEREARRADLEAQRQAEARAAEDLARRQAVLDMGAAGGEPMTESQTPTADPSPPSSAHVPPPKPKPTAAERRAAMDQRDATFARELLEANRLLEHLARMTDRRTTAAA